ncbi:hypothetical protein ACH4D5_20555 [Streptomyces sp. NPDC018029]
MRKIPIQARTMVRADRQVHGNNPHWQWRWRWVAKAAGNDARR